MKTVLRVKIDQLDILSRLDKHNQPIYPAIQYSWLCKNNSIIFGLVLRWCLDLRFATWFNDFIMFIDGHSFCRMARSHGALFFLLLAVVIGKFCLAENEVKECIKGSLHKDKPSPEGADYVECQPWKENACCTAEFTAELKRNNVEVLYNFSWNHCANLSQVRYACQALIKMWWISFGRIFLQTWWSRLKLPWPSHAMRIRSGRGP